jgi:3-hydroxybutyryl-CoA dehydrogenase
MTAMTTKPERIAVIGAGTMGSGIAQISAQAGLSVALLDVSLVAAQRGIDTIARALQRQVDKALLSADQRERALSCLQPHTSYEALSDCTLVIEAASESLATKKAILAQLQGVLRPSAVIASNTSSLSITELAAGLSAPERVIGLHFFNPVPVLKLVEVIRGLHTSDATVERVMALAMLLGKSPISVGNAPGFVVNRILVPMLNEAIFVLQEGLASAEAIDSGMTLGCGHPLGPLALADLVGLDTLLAILEAFTHGFGDPKYRPAPLLREMVSAGAARQEGRLRILPLPVNPLCAALVAQTHCRKEIVDA